MVSVKPCMSPWSISKSSNDLEKNEKGEQICIRMQQTTLGETVDSIKGNKSGIETYDSGLPFIS